MVKNAFISGATKGIGKAVATKLAQEGFNLFVTARNKQDLAALKTSFETQYHIQVETYSVDYASADDVLKFCVFLSNQILKFNIIVNNTGIYTLNDGLGNTEDLSTLLQVNLLAHQSVTKTLYPFLEKTQAHIFNIGSIVSKYPRNEAAFYTISKTAFANWTNILFETLRKENIKVTHIIPSGTYTSSWENAPVNQKLLLKSEEIADVIWNAYNTPQNTVIEEIVIRKTEEL